MYEKLRQLNKSYRPLLKLGKVNERKFIQVRGLLVPFPYFNSIQTKPS